MDNQVPRDPAPAKYDVEPRDHQSDGIVAALDLGSNTIKMTLGQLDETGELVEFGWASETVRLGTGVAATGRLADDRVAAALATLKRFADAARGQGASRLVGVATEATRTASNGPAFIEQVRNEIGWDIQSITGSDEAELTFRGLARTIDTTGRVVIADIGGGSTELIVATDGHVAFSRSFPVGSGSLTDRHIVSDPPTATGIAACEEDAATTLAPADLPTDGGNRLIAVGGTGKYLQRLLSDQTTIALPDVRRVLGLLSTVPAAELAARLTIPVARAHVLPAGIAVIAAVASRLGDPPITVGPSGIRTGLLLRAFESIPART